jgi:hypothetical protein
VVKCRSCPVAVHAGCVKNCLADDINTWQCRDCAAGRRPVYGEIVWAKVGNYRFVTYSILTLSEQNSVDLSKNFILLSGIVLGTYERFVSHT